MLRILVRLLQLIIFLVILVFALKNTDTVALKFFLGWQWQAPLILLLLVFFLAGALLGVLGLLPMLFFLRSELNNLRNRQLQPQTPSRVARNSIAEISDLAPPADHVRT